MRFYLTLFFVLFSFNGALAQNIIVQDDRALNCRQLETEIGALKQTGQGSSTTVISQNTINNGASVATQAASMAGVGAEASLIHGVFKLFSPIFKSSAAKPSKLSIDVQKRIERLETIAEMKDCYE